MLYRGMDRTALDAAYNNGAAVGLDKRTRYVEDWTVRTKALSQRPNARIDIRYGAAPRQRLDFWPSARKGAPTFVFIHGGYWHMSDKENYGFVAEGPLAHGLNVASVEYTLAPAIRLDGIVAEVRQAIQWVVGHLGELGAATDGIYVAGHSAGGHLTAMVATEPGVKGAIPISGLFDLEPLRHNYIGEAVRMDEAEVQRNSPILHLPDKAPPLVITVGGDELPELRRQSEDYYAAWTKKGLRARYLPLAGHEHFSILEEFASPQGKLTTALLDLVAGRI